MFDFQKLSAGARGLFKLGSVTKEISKMNITSVSGSSLSINEKSLNEIKIFSKEEFFGKEYCDYVGTPLYSSELFRKKAIQAGFYLVSLYSVYHQGWEMDEWGAVATRDGKKYNITTNHGSLVVEEMRSFFSSVINFLSRKLNGFRL